MNKRIVRYEPLSPKSVLNAVRAPAMPFDWSINPYRGCQHGCSFCYARSTHAFLGDTADDAFQNHIYWKERAPEVLREQLRVMGRRRPASVVIGTATDPYQQVEGQARLTRGCLEVLAEFGIAAHVTTRSPLILRDIDLLRHMPGSSVNVSLHTLDFAVWREFEPSTPSPPKRLEAVRKLNEAGVTAGVFLAPILPHLTDAEESTQAVIAACREAGARYVMPSFLRLSTPEVKSWFFAALSRTHPHLTEVYGRYYWRSGHAPETYRHPVRERIRRQLAEYGLRYDDRPSRSAQGDRRSPQSREGGPAQPQPRPDGICAPVQLTLF